MKKILTLGLLLGLIGGLVAYFMYNKPHRDIAKEQAAFTTTADEIFAAYEADEAGANKKFLDKVIKISGKLVEAGKNKDGQSNGVLEAADAMIGGVSVTMAATSTTELKKGETVSLKCRCTGKLMDVVLVNCFKD